MSSASRPRKLELPQTPEQLALGKTMKFSVTGTSLPSGVSSALAAACDLIPSMAARRPLVLPGPLDPRLDAALPRVMDFLSRWNSTLRPVPVRAGKGPAEPTPPKPERGVAACFSGGADSFYTLITRRDEIDTLVYVLGFDLERKQARLWEQAHSMLERVAAHYRKRLVIVETNLRHFWDRLLPWDMTYASGLAAAGHFLSHEIKRLIIPSSLSTAQLHPCGSDPAFDPLWSSERLEIEHDTCAPTRLDKLRALIDEQFPLDFLRVCWENPEQAYNCGKCLKCFRTMAGLAALGALHRVPAFPSHIDLASVARLDIGDETEGLFLREVLDELRRTGREPELAEFLEKIPAVRHLSEKVFSVLRDENRSARAPLVIRAAKLEVSENRTSLCAPVEWGELKTRLEVDYDLGGEAPGCVGDALLVWFILVAMRQGVPLVLEDAVSAELLKGIDQAQGLWSTHRTFAGLSRVEVRASVASFVEIPAKRPWAAAFSSGVDALFTAMRERDRIKHLVWIDGMDSEAIDPVTNGQHHQWVKEGAESLGKNLVTARSNLRRVLFRELGLNWEFMYLMSPIGMAHLMQSQIGGLWLAAEFSYSEIVEETVPARYNPLLDPWLSSRRVAVKMHGMTHNRLKKIAALCEHPALIGKLLVCPQRAIRGLEYGRNCGRCDKCVATLIAIRVAGGRHPAEAFDAPLDLNLLRHHETGLPLVFKRLRYYSTILEHLKRHDGDAELQEILIPLVRQAGIKSGIRPPAASAFEALRNDPSWAKMLKARATEAAELATGDKPSQRLTTLMKREPSQDFGHDLVRALLHKEGRAKLLRRAMGRVLRFDFTKEEKK